MRIAIDFRSLLEPFPSGISEYAYQIIRQLIAIDQKNEYLLFCNAQRPLPQRIVSSFQQDNVRLVARKIPNKVFNSLQVSFHKPLIDEMCGGADILFMPNMNFISLSKKAKLVVTLHDCSFLYPSFYSTKAMWWHRFIGPRKIISRADRIIAVSRSTKEDVLQNFGLPEKKVVVIYSGVDEKYFQMRSDQRIEAIKKKYSLRTPYVLFLGTVENRKNINGILQAWRDMSPDYKRKHQLLIAGKAMKRDIGSHDPSVRFLGYIDAEDKAYLYAQATAFIYPSFFEGFGLPVVEAMASGTPVITSFATALPEVSRGAAVYADPYNSADITRVIQQVLGDSRLREQLIQRGKECARLYSWEKSAHNTLEVFNSLV